MVTYNDRDSYTSNDKVTKVRTHSYTRMTHMVTQLMTEIVTQAMTHAKTSDDTIGNMIVTQTHRHRHGHTHTE